MVRAGRRRLKYGALSSVALAVAVGFIDERRRVRGLAADRGAHQQLGRLAAVSCKSWPGLSAVNGPAVARAMTT